MRNLSPDFRTNCRSGWRNELHFGGDSGILTIPRASGPKAGNTFPSDLSLAQFRDAANERTKERTDGRTGNIEGQMWTDAPPFSGLACAAGGGTRASGGVSDQAKREGIRPTNKTISSKKWRKRTDIRDHLPESEHEPQEILHTYVIQDSRVRATY